MSVALGCGLHGLPSEGFSGENWLLGFLLLVCNYKHFFLISGADCCRWEVALGKVKAGVLLDVSVGAVWYLGNVMICNQPGFHRQTSARISVISPVAFRVPILPSGNGCPF